MPVALFSLRRPRRRPERAADLNEFVTLARQVVDEVGRLRAANDKIASALHVIAGRLETLEQLVRPTAARQVPAEPGAPADTRSPALREPMGHPSQEDGPDPFARRGPGRSTAPQPEGLIGAWEALRSEVGMFSAGGLHGRLQSTGLDVEVLEQPPFTGLAVVVWPAGANEGFVVPDFSKPITALEPWFDIHGRPARTAIVARLLNPAVVRRSGEVVKRGAVE